MPGSFPCAWRGVGREGEAVCHARVMMAMGRGGAGSGGTCAHVVARIDLRGDDAMAQSGSKTYTAATRCAGSPFYEIGLAGVFSMSHFNIIYRNQIEDVDFFISPISYTEIKSKM